MTNETTKPSINLWDWVKAVSTLIMVSVFSYKVFTSDFSITVDTTTLLSLLLALFSIGLSALFYFKATETSNAFYDNTFRYTKDIATLLTKIDSGFGERLDNLKDSYTSIHNSMKNNIGIHGNDIEEAEKKFEEEKLKLTNKLKEETSEKDKVIEERNAIINTLTENSNLKTEEKDNIIKELKSRDRELNEIQTQIDLLNRVILEIREPYVPLGLSDLDLESKDNLDRHTQKEVLPNMNIKWSISNTQNEIDIRKEFLKVSMTDGFSNKYLRDLERYGYIIDYKLTKAGVEYLIKQAYKSNFLKIDEKITI